MVLLLDCASDMIETLLDRLKFYKLRAAATLTDRSADYASVAFPEATAKPELDAIALAADPRSAGLGWRGLVTREIAATIATAPRAAYDASASPPPRRRAESISSMATLSRMRPIWTASPASTSKRAASSARRWSRA